MVPFRTCSFPPYLTLEHIFAGEYTLFEIGNTNILVQILGLPEKVVILLLCLLSSMIPAAKGCTRATLSPPSRVRRCHFAHHPTRSSQMSRDHRVARMVRRRVDVSILKSSLSASLRNTFLPWRIRRRTAPVPPCVSKFSASQTRW